VILPDKVALQIVECEQAVKGDTVSGSAKTKNAKVETGLDIKVPMFIENGEIVLVSTADGKYSGRA
ncbi:MAG: elongation factor P, partial [Erysipelotrichaceae bacterium]|nr:elongation factor P [Erysipelotrichaceae bacterium]